MSLSQIFSYADYTNALLGNNTAESQYTVLTLLVYVTFSLIALFLLLICARL